MAAMEPVLKSWENMTEAEATGISANAARARGRISLGKDGALFIRRKAYKKPARLTMQLIFISFLRRAARALVDPYEATSIESTD